MNTLTSEGQQWVDELAARSAFSREAVAHMVAAVLAGNGQSAQFDHREFGGAGQWMRGGMIMLSDMLNNTLKSQVDALCTTISDTILSRPDWVHRSTVSSQRQSGSYDRPLSSSPSAGQSSRFVADAKRHWWPEELGTPSSVGAQNDTAYAYFPDHRRLAVKTATAISVHDTLEHRISGFSQQQGTTHSITFTSQLGAVALQTLPVVMHTGDAPTPAPTATESVTTSTRSEGEDVFTAIEKLSTLRDKGILSEEEFLTKKTELLNRI